MAGPEVLIREAALLHNLECLRRAAGQRVLLPVLKADAYGHSAELIARICETHLSAAELPCFVVARTTEALELRARGVRRSLLVLSSWYAEEIQEGWPEATALTIVCEDDVRQLEALPRERVARIEGAHLDLNTGMNRLGCRVKTSREAVETLSDWAVRLRRIGLPVLGLMSHLARGEEDPALLSKSQEQFFQDVLTALREAWPSAAGAFPRWVHLANSPGLLKGVGLSGDCNAVRPGLHLWGLYQNGADPRVKPLQAVAEVRAPVRQMFWLESGEGLGYGHRFVCPRRTLIGTIPLGYADGVNRRLSRKAHEASRVGFVVEGARVPVAGTVSMDLTMVDLTDHPRAAEWGGMLAQGKQATAEAYWICAQQPAEEIADALGTIAYEVTCALSRRLPRRWVKGAL